MQSAGSGPRVGEAMRISILPYDALVPWSRAVSKVVVSSSVHPL